VADRVRVILWEADDRCRRSVLQNLNWGWRGSSGLLEGDASHSTVRECNSADHDNTEENSPDTSYYFHPSLRTFVFIHHRSKPLLHVTLHTAKTNERKSEIQG
jgi:hypothetical protein